MIIPMQDFIEKYKKRNLSMHLSLISLSFILALSIHLFIKDSGFTQNLKWNVLEQTTFSENTWDIALKNVSNEIQSVMINKNVENVVSMSFSLTYNPDNLDILSVIPAWNITSNVEIISNTAGFVTVLATFPTPISIEKETELFNVRVNKKDTNISFINLVQANITNTTNEISNLSSSGIDF